MFKFTRIFITTSKIKLLELETRVSDEFYLYFGFQIHVKLFYNIKIKVGMYIKQSYLSNEIEKSLIGVKVIANGHKS